nr:DNA polymerase III subunit gamma/tau [Armatimonadota bacterium]
AHAYLFCGPRGTGKTSTARLLAKALNCIHGPTPTPCNECDLCRGVSTGRAMDVVEVDAASETGIDNVREVIINNARYAPAEGRYKVFIIDEVHDLSRAAFDGLLKTLEEPPPHVVFVLATTEIHKVPATIISRCQRFEFRRGSQEEVRSRVDFVAKEEGVTLDPAASALIARAAQGGWRDALSLLEQVISYAGDVVAAKDVSAVLGAIEDETLEALTRQILEKDAMGAIMTLDSLLAEGKDIRQLLHNFVDYVRDCLMQSMGGARDETRPLLSLPREAGMHLLECTARTERELRWNTQHRLVMELMILRMTSTEEIGRPAVAAVMAAPSAVLPTAGPAVKTSRRTPVDSPPVQEEPFPSRPVQSAPAAAPARPNGSSLPPVTSANSPVAAEGGTFNGSPAGENSSFPGLPASAGAMVTASGSPAIDLEAVLGQWKPFLNRVGAKSRRLQALLREATPIACSEGVLLLQFKQQYHYQGVEDNAARRELESVLAQLFGQPLKITCTLEEDTSGKSPARSGRRAAEALTENDLQELFPGWEIHED